MQPADFERFRAVMAGMAELYQRELSPTLLDAYWVALRDWPLDDFQSAAAHLMGTATFMPRPADFNALRKAARLTAVEAWDAAIRACPGWRDGSASVDPLTDRVVAMLGGYRHLAMERLDVQHFTRAKFIEFFESMSETADARATLPNQLTHSQLLALADDKRKQAARLEVGAGEP